jgi:HTH-type transcriptional regulator / antitoxin HigA
VRVRGHLPLVLPTGSIGGDEERRWPLKSQRRFDPVDVLHYAIKEFGHSQAELADILGSRSRASEVLARRRPLTLEMIQKITASRKIPADLLVQPYRVCSDASRGIVTSVFSVLKIQTSPPKIPTRKDTAPNSTDTLTPSLIVSPA